MRTITNKKQTMTVTIEDSLYNKYSEKAKNSYRNNTQTIEQKAKELILTKASQILEHKKLEKQFEIDVINDTTAREFCKWEYINSFVVNYLIEECNYKNNEIQRLLNGNYIPESMQIDKRIAISIALKNLTQNPITDQQIIDSKRMLQERENYNFDFSTRYANCNEFIVEHI